MVDLFLPSAPYLNCFLSLLGGLLLGMVLSLLVRRGKIRPRLRDRLTVFITLGLWLAVTAVLWFVDRNNPFTNRFNQGGGLS